MDDKISWMFKANVTGGPSITVDGLIPIEAYDMVEALVPKKGETTGSVATLEVQPSTALFLLIKASDYPINNPLEYKIGESSSTSSSHTLDGPHIFIGSGAVSFLGNSQNTFTFTNTCDKDLTVYILVGRIASKHM
jgi:hypothetical protein